MIINDFHGKHFFLSNFYESKFYYDGHEWKSVEHAFQAAKCVKKEDYIAILNAKTPGEAKRIGRTVQMVEDWDNIRCHVMHECLLMKFLGDDELMNKLLATGDAELIEGNTWHDNFWGSCHCNKCNDSGKNMLGNMLMEIRYNCRHGNYCWVAVDSFEDSTNHNDTILKVFKDRDTAMYFISSHKNQITPFEAGGYRIKPILFS